MHRRDICFGSLLALTAPFVRAWPEMPAPLRPLLEGTRLAGKGRLRFLGLAMYDARLWVTPGFRREAFETRPFVLELQYLRAFGRDAIARRSIEEMRRQPDLPGAPLTEWEQRMRAALPDVAPGDRVAGVHVPGEGARFVINGGAAERIDDPRFSRHFFGIWLSPHTSEPALREALLAGVPAS